MRLTKREYNRSEAQKRAKKRYYSKPEKLEMRREWSRMYYKLYRAYGKKANWPVRFLFPGN